MNEVTSSEAVYRKLFVKHKPHETLTERLYFFFEPFRYLLLFARFYDRCDCLVANLCRFLATLKAFELVIRRRL